MPQSRKAGKHLIPGEPSPSNEELVKPIYYRLFGGGVGSIFVIATYLISRSTSLTFFLFIGVAFPLWLGTDYYLIFKMRAWKAQNKPYSIKLLRFQSFAHGFTIYAIGIILAIYLLYHFIHPLL